MPLVTVGVNFLFKACCHSIHNLRWRNFIVIQYIKNKKQGSLKCYFFTTLTQTFVILYLKSKRRKIKIQIFENFLIQRYLFLQELHGFYMRLYIICYMRFIYI